MTTDLEPWELPAIALSEGVERFLSKIDRSGEGGCWIWRGTVLTSTGYGQFKLRGRKYTAHRFAYELFVGPIPTGLVTDHLCRVRRCVNPAHLEPVDQRTNILRGTGPTAANAKKTHCPRGHKYDIELERGYRSCSCYKEVRRAYAYRRYWEQKNAAEAS